MPELNIRNMKKAMNTCCRRCLSVKTGIPVQRIDQFLDGCIFPEPHELLKIGVQLGLPFEKLVIEDESTCYSGKHHDKRSKAGFAGEYSHADFHH